jgi:hypothetical protein
VNHYLQITLAEGKMNVSREYVLLLHEHETIEEATGRWIEKKLGNRKRNRALAEAKIRNEIISRRICRPSSWHKAMAEAEGREIPSFATKRRKR